jgi:solute carrier family 25 citrate transporter 1
MFNNPVDVVKTKMQGLEAAKYGGFTGCFKYIMKNEGVMGFYSGVGPRLCRVVLDVAITFSVFNSLKRLIISKIVSD